MNIYNNAADRIALLPAILRLNGSFAFADGGTVGLSCELQDSTVITIYLPPAKSILYQDQNIQLYLQIYYADSQAAETHFIAVRSELESQVVTLLKNSDIDYRLTRLDLKAKAFYGYPVEEIGQDERVQRNDDIRRIRDKIVAFVESDEYVRLNAARDKD